ncbi:MAG: zinc ribbon domain-containing protein [Turicibacter sp.]|nr:zinc ribbon domain-containing protein [Turicibacter sp.]
MLFIGGIDAQQQEIGQFDSVRCLHCGENHAMDLVKTFYYFHFFFLPLFKWNVKYLVTCGGCQAVMAVPSDVGKDLENGKSHDIDPADLTILQEGHAKRSHCSNCSHEVSSEYAYCPHCGEKMEVTS